MAQARAARDQLTQREYWLAAGCPERHRTQIVHPRGTADKWDRAFAWALNVIQQGGICALIGDRGTGKTQIFTEIVRRLTMGTNPPRVCRYVRAADLFSSLRDEMRKDGASEGRSIDAWIRPFCLGIDEAHERNPNSDFEPRILNNILDKRYGALRGSALIANVDGNSDQEMAENFRRLIGETIFDRLSETGGIRICNWPSFRVPHPKGGQ